MYQSNQSINDNQGINNAYPFVSIIILNWNGLSDTIECLESVKNNNYPNYEIIVVDNGSTDGSPEKIKQLFPEVIIIRNNENLGFAMGNNIGIKYALRNNADYILLLNNDTIVEPSIVSSFVEAASLHPNTGIFGGKIYYYTDPNRFHFVRAKWNQDKGDFVSIDRDIIDDKNAYNSFMKTDYVCGCAMFIKADIIEKIGLFNPNYFLCQEEVDLCSRSYKHGYECLIVPKIKIWHKISTSFSSIQSPLKSYFNSRNKLLWAKLNLPIRQRWALYALVIKGLFPRTFNKERYLLIKKLYWDILEIVRQRNDPRFRFKILGIKDFIFNHFGRCRYVR